MKMGKIGPKKILGSAIALLLGFCALQAQEEQRIQKTLKIGKYQGEASFGYTVVQGDTVLDGDFLMQRSNVLELLERQDYSFLFKGRFNKGVPQGDWVFEFGDFQSNKASNVVDYQYRVLVTGTQESAKGRITNGRPDGTWIILEEDIKDSEIEKTVFKSEISFANGVPERSFQIMNENQTLVGRFLRNGLAHDEWSLFSQNGMTATESWYFNEGILRSIGASMDGSVFRIPIFKNTSNEQVKVLNLDQRYLAVVDYYMGLQTEYPLAAAKLPDLLQENAKHYANIQHILSDLGESTFSPQFKVGVPYFPLSANDSTLVEEVKAQVKEASAISRELLGNSQLNLLQLTNTEVRSYARGVEQLKDRLLLPLQKLVVYDSLGILPYLDPNVLDTVLWPNGVPAVLDVSNISEVSSEALLPSALHEENGTSAPTGYALLEKRSTQTLYALKDLKKTLARMLAKDKRENELVAIEDSLVMRQKRLQLTLDSMRVKLPAKYGAALAGVGSLAVQRLALYSEGSNGDDNLAMARKTLVCLEDLQEITETLGEMPNYAERIMVAYTDRIWNPFTATLMDETVKKRIPTAYQKTVEPYFLNTLASELSCENAQELHSDIVNAYERVLYLRNAETTKLERRLKRAKNPREILQFLYDETLIKNTRP